MTIGIRSLAAGQFIDGELCLMASLAMGGKLLKAYSLSLIAQCTVISSLSIQPSSGMTMVLDWMVFQKNNTSSRVCSTQ